MWGTQIETSQGVMFMHPYSGPYSDQELAALGNFTIGQFGFRKGAITVEQIRALRKPGVDKPAADRSAKTAS
jgi:hypothetical protein